MYRVRPQILDSVPHRHHFAHAAMRVEHCLAEFLAEVDLGFLVVGVRLVLDDVEMEMIERAPHLVEAILRLHQNLVESILDRPRFLLLRERAEMTLAPPIAARAADPGIEDAPAIEFHVVTKTLDQVRQLRNLLLGPDFVRHFVRRGDDGAGIVREWRHRHQNKVVAVLQAPDDLGGGLPALVFAEELLDVLNLQRALLEWILRDAMLQR